MATKTKKSKAARKPKAAAEPTRVVVPGVLVYVRANPRYFRGYSDNPVLVREFDTKTGKINEKTMKTGWVEARGLKVPGAVEVVAREYEHKTHSCGREVTESNRAVILVTRDGAEYVPGPAFEG